MTDGRWRVWTEQSCYLIDLHECWIEREPDAGLGEQVPYSQLPEVAPVLRKDGERIPLIQLYQCEVGKPMQMLLQIRDDGVVTVRTTSIVREKRPV